MGLRDTAEQLDACKAQSVRDEARIADLQGMLTGAKDLAGILSQRVVALEARIEDRDRQVAELEHDLARAESALADRLRHDAHAHPTGHTIDRAALIALLSGFEIDTADEEETADRILALLQPTDGVLITAEEAQLTIRACRHSAESIRAVLDVDPARLHPDVAPYVERLTDLADRLQEHG
jgi:chromosome segregation ATPase